MFITILSVLLVLVGIVLFIVPIKYQGDVMVDGRYGPTRERATKTVTRAIGLIPVGIAALIMALACTTVVQAKQVGVVTTFGKPGDTTLSSGLHVKAPWQKVTEIDATIQTDEYHGDSGIIVRLNDGNTAKVSATIRWSVSEENANEVYADFRSDDPTKSLRDAVVSTQFKAAMNTVFSTFDPLSLAGGEGTEAPNYIALAQDVETAMLARTNDLVTIESVTISLLSLDDKSQAKIDAYIGEVAKTRIAEQAQKTAEKQAEANRILSDSISNDPNVLVSKCFDLLAEGYDAPAGFTCWPGGNGSVVVPSAR